MSKLTIRVGFWASICCTLLFLAFNAANVAVVIQGSTQGWPGIQAYVAPFQMAESLPQSIGLLLVSAAVVVLATIYALTSADQKIWSLLGLAFGLLFVALVGTTYVVHLAIVRPGLLVGQEDALAMLSLTSGRSLMETLHTLGWGFLGLATLFTAWVFDGRGLEGWIRWLLVLHGISSVAAVIGYVLGSPPLQAGVVFSWVVFPTATFLLSVRLQRAGKRVR